MPEAFHFGVSSRALFGLRHPPALPRRGAVLACMPLLQEGIRCQRALWSLSEALAAAGLDVLRFDWYGSGDSSGETNGLTIAGMANDIATAEAFLRASAPGLQPRLFALRSAALPLLVHASRRSDPVDMVLWAPVLDGRALVAAWREQHGRQLHAAGRFPRAGTGAGDDELLGFVLDPALPAGIHALDGRDLLLPAGSSLLVVQWPGSPVDGRFLAAQHEAGVQVDCLELDTPDEPDWDDPDGFEAQLFPRRAVNQLADSLAGSP